MQPADARRDKRGGVLNYYYYHHVQVHSFLEEEDDAMSVAINQTTAPRCHRVVAAGIPSQCSVGLNSN